MQAAKKAAAKKAAALGGDTAMAVDAQARGPDVGHEVHAGAHASAASPGALIPSPPNHGEGWAVTSIGCL